MNIVIVEPEELTVEEEAEGLSLDGDFYAAQTITTELSDDVPPQNLSASDNQKILDDIASVVEEEEMVAIIRDSNQRASSVNTRVVIVPITKAEFLIAISLLGKNTF